MARRRPGAQPGNKNAAGRRGGTQFISSGRRYSAGRNSTGRSVGSVTRGNGTGRRLTASQTSSRGLGAKAKNTVRGANVVGSGAAGLRRINNAEGSKKNQNAVLRLKGSPSPRVRLAGQGSVATANRNAYSRALRFRLSIV